MISKPFAFVLMPFDPAFDDIYRLGIQAAANECEVIAERVDEQRFTESMLDRIYRQIEVADFIVADMTGRNANVFYEVGYAHARNKLCTLLTQSAEDIPFDLKHHRHIVYGQSIQSLKSNLIDELRWLIAERDKRKTKAISIELKSATADLHKSSYRAEAEVTLKFDIHNRTSKKSPEIEAIYLITGKNWKFEQNKEECAQANSDTSTTQVRHFLKPPITRLSPGAWAQITVVGKKTVGWKIKGDELKDSYHLSGRCIVEIFTSEGSFSEEIDVSVDAEEFPF